jgi:hypothetical protein
MYSRVIALVLASSHCGTRPQCSAMAVTSSGAKPPSLRRSVGSIATIKALAVATCTFHADAAASSASRIKRALGSLTETLSSPFSASSLESVSACSAC